MTSSIELINTKLKISEELPKENNNTFTKINKNTKLEENSNTEKSFIKEEVEEKEQNVKEIITEKPKVPKSPITNSNNFQRLSKIRLNMGSGRRNTVC